MARSAPARFELVFVDPPFDAELSLDAATVAAPLVVEGGFLYVEAALRIEEPPAGMTLYRSLRAGAVHAHLFVRGQ
jgi:16S rRNA (guanine966-N2)-methyltransferase